MRHIIKFSLESIITSNNFLQTVMVASDKKKELECSKICPQMPVSIYVDIDDSEDTKTVDDEKKTSKIANANRVKNDLKKEKKKEREIIVTREFKVVEVYESKIEKYKAVELEKNEEKIIVTRKFKELEAHETKIKKYKAVEHNKERSNNNEKLKEYEAMKIGKNLQRKGKEEDEDTRSKGNNLSY